VVEITVPTDLADLVQEKRMELIERLAEVDDEVAEAFLAEEELTVEQLKAAIRRQTIALKFVPVFMGSAFKNKGVQRLLDGVLDFLPNPTQVHLGSSCSRQEPGGRRLSFGLFVAAACRWTTTRWT
jgi:elongation factor G